MTAVGAAVRRSIGRSVQWPGRLAEYSAVALVFLAALLLYARTAAPGLLDGDEGEFQTNIGRLGVSPTGYPIFFLVGKLWTLLVPVGTVATRANLFAAFWGAAAAAALYIFIRWLTGQRWSAVLAALLLLVSRVEWSQSIIPRPYTLNSFFVIVVTFLFFLWRVGRVDLTVPVFAFGLSLTNHRTMLWFAPAIAVWVLWRERGALFRPRRLFSLVLAFAVPLLLYGYVFWRGESDVGVEFHMKDFSAMILAGNASGWWRFGPVDWVVTRVSNLYVPLLVEQFTVLGFLAGLIGFAALALDRPPRGWPLKLPAREALVFIALVNAANSAFCVFFDTIDVEKFFLPSYITFLLLIAVGIAVLAERWVVSSHSWTRVLGPVSLILFCGSIIFLIISNFSVNDWSGRTDVTRAWAENMAQPLEPHALIAGPWESLTPLEYYQYVDGRRRDLERWKVITQNYLLPKAFYDSRQGDIEREVRAGRPVYLTVYPGETETLTGLLEEFRFTHIGELWRVVDAPPSDTLTLARLKTGQPRAVFKDGAGRALELLDYSLRPGPTLRAGDFGLATLYWRAPEPFSDRLAISVRLSDAQNHLIAQRDAEPANGLRSTAGWAPNEIVQDDVGFIVPADAPPGTLYLRVVVYNTATGENLTTGDLVFTLADLTVTDAVPPVSPQILAIPHPLDLALPPFRLLGYALGNSNPKGGDGLDLSLWWQLDGQATPDEKITLSLQDASGHIVNLYAGAPLDLPSGAWPQAGILHGRYSLAVPIDFSGSARLRVESGGRVAEIAALQVLPSGRSFAVPQIAHPDSAQLGDSVKLLGYDLDKTRAHPGETVRLTCYWQALKTPGAGFTVFAHLLDANGVLRGQKDAPPRNGELATDRWLPGEVIADAHEIAIAPDAPAGKYQFEVGMYLLETGERMAVLDAGGARVQADRVLLGELNVER